MTPDQLDDFATRYTAAWNAHDAEKAASFYAKDGSLTIMEANRHRDEQRLRLSSRASAMLSQTQS